MMSRSIVRVSLKMGNEPLKWLSSRYLKSTTKRAIPAAEIVMVVRTQGVP
jgi:hypothetical protein